MNNIWTIYFHQISNLQFFVSYIYFFWIEKYACITNFLILFYFQSNGIKLRYQNEDPAARLDVDVTDILQIAVCIPDGCYPSDIFGQLGIDQYCSVNEPTTFDAGDIACL